MHFQFDRSGLEGQQNKNYILHTCVHKFTRSTNATLVFTVATASQSTPRQGATYLVHCTCGHQGLDYLNSKFLIITPLPD